VKHPLRILLIVLGVLLFLVISGVLARFLSAENLERDADLNLVKAEVAGNARSLIGQISGCASNPACVVIEQSNAKRLRRAGSPKILSLMSPTAYTLTGKTGKTRLAWKVTGHFPVVQCITVRRGGNAITGISVTLTALSRPITETADC
jgi:hypothetical protein